MVKFGESMQKFETDITSKKRIIKIDSDAEFNIEKDGVLKVGDISLSFSQCDIVRLNSGMKSLAHKFGIKMLQI